MKNELATVKSDLLELKRDTATYDYCFTSSKQTYEVLTSVDHVADHSTELTATLESVTDGQQSISAFIRNKLEALHSLKTQSLILKNEERSIPKLEYGLRESQGGDKFEKLFAGAVVISGMHCLIRATGNEIFKKLGIFGQTINGSRLDQLLISVKEKTFDVRSFIHTKLYLTVDKGNIRLLAHENYGKSFVQLLISLPEHQYTYAKITSKGESLWIFLPEIGEVQYKLENDLHSLNVRKVRGFVSKSLHHNPVTNQISWVGHFASSLRFALKESKSRLLNPEYLAKLLETECQTKNRYHYMCNGLRITIELSQCGVYEHLLLYTEKKTVTIEETDEMHGFLTGLQITDFRSNWQTLMKSLEMKMCVTVLLAKGEL